MEKLHIVQVDFVSGDFIRVEARAATKEEALNRVWQSYPYAESVEWIGLKGKV